MTSALLAIAASVGASGCTVLTGFGDLEFDQAADSGARDLGRDTSAMDAADDDADLGPDDAGREDRRPMPGDGAMPDGAVDTGPTDGGGDVGPGDADRMDAGDLGLVDGGATDMGDAAGGGEAGTSDGAIPCATPADCDDREPCTMDRCSAAGRCEHENRADESDCDDGNLCTTEWCVGGVCTTTDIRDCTAALGPCDLSHECVPASGMCRVVRRPAGAPCVSSNRCAVGAACTATGACVGDSSCSTVDDGNECTVSMCSMTGCVHVPRVGPCDGGAGECCGGECVDTQSDADHCGVCLNPCFAGQRCVLGTCQGCATNDQCNDDRPCTADLCESGACTNRLSAGFCLIDGACYLDGEENPSNECLHCAPMTPGVWTARTGQACDDGLFCTDPDRCSSMGACGGDARMCPDNDCNFGFCNEDANACHLVPRAAGTGCGTVMFLQECCDGACVSAIPGC